MSLPFHVAPVISLNLVVMINNVVIDTRTNIDTGKSEMQNPKLVTRFPILEARDRQIG
jgi:hypothetical protein